MKIHLIFKKQHSLYQRAQLEETPIMGTNNLCLITEKEKVFKIKKMILEVTKQKQ